MKQKIAAILLTALALISIQQPILGYTISQSDLDAIRRNHPFYDPNASCSSSGSSSTNTGESDSEPNGPGKLFIIGDSIGSGLIGPLGTELGANWSVTGDTRVGRPLSEGITVAKSAPEGLKNAQYILVVLGTNPDNKMTQAGINEMLSAITTNNSSAKIFWLRINVTREDLVANATSFNGLLSSTSGITALDNSSILAGDGVHPSNYTELAKSIASNISSGSSNQGNTGSQSSNPCGPCPINGLSGILPVEGENAERAFKFFLSVGYTPEWAAGIVGNMIAESGVEPQRLQNTASGVITPASEAVAPLGETGKALVLKIVPAESTVSYTIDEVLRDVPTRVVGVTNSVAGEVALTPNQAEPLRIGDLAINARTLKTDSDRRDGAVARMILKSEKPENEFIVLKNLRVQGLTSSLVPGVASSFTATGGSHHFWHNASSHLRG